MTNNDPLAKVAEREDRRKCLHPNLRFGRNGYELACVDCKRRWVTALDGYEIPDYSYSNVGLTDQEFRHSPNETPRREPAKKPAPPAKPAKGKIR